MVASNKQYSINSKYIIIIVIIYRGNSGSCDIVGKIVNNGNKNL